MVLTAQLQTGKCKIGYEFMNVCACMRVCVGARACVCVCVSVDMAL